MTRTCHCKALSWCTGIQDSIGTLLLLLLSRFSRVQLYATPSTAAQQAPLSLGFSRQEHWSGLPFPSPVRESEVAQSYPTLCDPMDCSPSGSSVHESLQARILEWVAISSSRAIGMLSSLNYVILSADKTKIRRQGDQLSPFARDQGVPQDVGCSVLKLTQSWISQDGWSP